MFLPTAAQGFPESAAEKRAPELERAFLHPRQARQRRRRREFHLLFVPLQEPPRQAFRFPAKAFAARESLPIPLRRFRIALAPELFPKQDFPLRDFLHPWHLSVRRKQFQQPNCPEPRYPEKFPQQRRYRLPAHMQRSRSPP